MAGGDRLARRLMLTGPLVRVRVRGNELHPGYIDPDKPDLQEVAAALVELFHGAVADGWTRGQVADGVEQWIGNRRDHKLLRGLAKLADDRSTYEVSSGVSPEEVRAAVFRKATELGPLAAEAGPLQRATATDVFAVVARELGTPEQELRASLYADLKTEQAITACEVPSGEWLLHRYNVALVQALLLHATEVRVLLEKPTVPRLRQLMRYVKFHQLIHQVERRDGWVTLVLDGPLSMFSMSTRYGLQLANFLPAVLLQDGRWQLEATVLWTRAKQRKVVTVSPVDGLRSHYADTGAYRRRVHDWFEERWAARDPEWEMTADTKPIDLGGRAVVLPDYTFRRDGRVAHLEILGFWRKEQLERRIELLKRYGRGNLILAVSSRLCGEATADLPGAVVAFAEVVPVPRVVEALDAIALPEP